MIKIFKSTIFIFLVSFVIFACGEENIADDDFGIFAFQDNETVVMDGLIDSDLPIYWDNYISTYPGTNRIIMKNCPGSTDDEANWEAAKNIHAHGVAIHLPEDAIIASGAVDLFLAGIARTREEGSQLGVHAWADGNGNEATDYPVGHEEHQGAINYYIDVGFTHEEAKAFYYFTINIAPAADIHWMTDEEIEQYKILK